MPFTFAIRLKNSPLTFVVTCPSAWITVSLREQAADAVLDPNQIEAARRRLGRTSNVPSMVFTTQRLTGNSVVSCRRAVVDVIVKLLFGISPAPWIKITMSGLVASDVTYEKSSAEVFAIWSFDAFRNPFVPASLSIPNMSALRPFTLIFVYGGARLAPAIAPSLASDAERVRKKRCNSTWRVDAKRFRIHGALLVSHWLVYRCIVRLFATPPPCPIDVG